MNKNCIISYNQSQIDEIAVRIIAFFEQCQIITLEGDLGSGKTTLIKSILKKCGITEVITSPTFTYMCCYKNSEGKVFYHFDLYRISSLKEFIELGFIEYLYESNSLCFIEWPEIVLPVINKRACYINIAYASLDTRILEYKFSSDIRFECK